MLIEESSGARFLSTEVNKKGKVTTRFPCQGPTIYYSSNKGKGKKESTQAGVAECLCP